MSRDATERVKMPPGNSHSQSTTVTMTELMKTDNFHYWVDTSMSWEGGGQEAVQRMRCKDATSNGEVLLQARGPDWQLGDRRVTSRDP